ncbi:MAG TPA: bifunctional proline dehydrogenase/L-glutamate gamma-semialdehyde dehydrogenase PutA [Bradyrhizobium sp.]|nr:bifunctional proline dehydrogenase/L-glutamate gamma-semialdehyde dehydrogenase PutA [Bradyrhizobium sp.]
MTDRAATIPDFSVPYAEDDGALAEALLKMPSLGPDRECRVDAVARRMIETIRASGGRLGGVENMLHEFALSTREGVAVMVLAEALLRIPDATTADRLIEDKLGQGDFVNRETKSQTLIVNASAWALGLTARILRPGETPDGVLAQLIKRVGGPAVRGAIRQAMRHLGNHYVLGQTIEEALERARADGSRLYRYSFDMLGEGARTAADAKRYFDSYAGAIDAIGRAAGHRGLPERPGISVKLSALHPRFESLSRARVLAELVPLVVALATKAKAYDLNFTVDAEEADRLELSIEVIGSAFATPALAGWGGFGLAIQAYQKRAGAVIDWVADLTERLGRRMMVRLVKGAYWDTEVKRAQERGLADYPVFTRKAMTDLNYMACANKLLGLRPRIFPQFATHNALTLASIFERAGGGAGYEFQRLHGMGEVLYDTALDELPGLCCRIYAPVGSHRDLLAYLVRRLLENGANSSFVSAVADPKIPVAKLLARPADLIGTSSCARHPSVPLPAALFGKVRKNSQGVEFGHRASVDDLLVDRKAASRSSWTAAPVVDGLAISGPIRNLISPIDGQTPSGTVVEADEATAARAIAVAQAGFRTWSRAPVEMRADTLARAADALEASRGEMIHLLQVESGKTIDDAVAEIREAVDFCRYYAAEAIKLFGDGLIMQGPTGETNRLRLRGRGVFVAISPWNFPLAIFVGQIAAALASGNTVVAKPAEQTPLVAAAAVRLLHAAGVPKAALQFVPGDGSVGSRLVADPRIDGVVFTGSYQVARQINQVLAAKTGPIVPLIAETGGINAMVVDATALLEQVTDDVVSSAFRSAGQRCSALRLLCVQDDIADQLIAMIAGAAGELNIGDPLDLATHVGPVIDREARDRLEAQISTLRLQARLHYCGTAPSHGFYIPPSIFEFNEASQLSTEVFGPVLHVVRYRRHELPDLLEAIRSNGYGLTFGIHSRIDGLAETMADCLPIGNVYVNRNMIGAVVGVQPFGGSGLSGTGPKAGGPNYLIRFASEQTITVNTSAAGGNANLMAAGELECCN